MDDILVVLPEIFVIFLQFLELLIDVVALSFGLEHPIVGSLDTLSAHAHLSNLGTERFDEVILLLKVVGGLVQLGPQLPVLGEQLVRLPLNCSEGDESGQVTNTIGLCSILVWINQRVVRREAEVRIGDRSGLNALVHDVLDVDDTSIQVGGHRLVDPLLDLESDGQLLLVEDHTSEFLFGYRQFSLKISSPSLLSSSLLLSILELTSLRFSLLELLSQVSYFVLSCLQILKLPLLNSLGNWSLTKEAHCS